MKFELVFELFDDNKLILRGYQRVIDSKL